jgi:hypothetical protein
VLSLDGIAFPSGHLCHLPRMEFMAQAHRTYVDIPIFISMRNFNMA